MTQDKAPEWAEKEADNLLGVGWGNQMQGVRQTMQHDIALALSQAYERGQVDMRERVQALLAHGAPHSPRRYIYDNTAARRIWACDKLDDAIRSLPIDSGKDA